MKVVHKICCGIDVHAKMLVACLILANGEKKIRSFSTMTDDLLRCVIGCWPRIALM